jgi:hypothetical protein
LDLASISRLNLELFNHKSHQMGPTLKEEIQGPGCEIMKEGFSGGQRSETAPGTPHSA